MSDAKTGREFIKHELDEAISIQKAVVGTARRLAKVHPEPPARRMIDSLVTAGERHLKHLRELGRPYEATGAAEEVSKALGSLADKTAGRADASASEAYEAHAVLLTLVRKQQDSAGAVLRIARAIKDADLRDAARSLARDAERSARQLADSLADLAVVLATVPATGEAERESAGRTRTGRTRRSATG